MAQECHHDPKGIFLARQDEIEAKHMRELSSERELRFGYAVFMPAMHEADLHLAFVIHMHHQVRQDGLKGNAGGNRHSCAI